MSGPIEPGYAGIPAQADTHHELLVHLHRLMRRRRHRVLMDVLKRADRERLLKRRWHDLRQEALSPSMLSTARHTLAMHRTHKGL